MVGVQPMMEDKKPPGLEGKDMVRQARKCASVSVSLYKKIQGKMDRPHFMGS